MGRLFGTDGVRGIANKELTPELAFNLGKAGAAVLSRDGKRPVFVIGRDTRLSGDMLENALTRLLGKPPMIVGPGVKTGLNIRMEIHNQLGADLVADAVAALEKYPAPIIVIDMGTATTISYISAKHAYEGGLMFPGVRLSLDALSDHAAQLSDISLQYPKNLIGKNTEDCMRNGIVYGTAGMLDGIIDRIRETIPEETPTIVATGNNAPVIVRYCRNKVVYDKYLLMEGLWAIYHKNRV